VCMYMYSMCVVCMYICVCVQYFMCVHMAVHHIHTCTHTYAYMHIHIHTYIIHIYIHTCVFRGFIRALRACVPELGLSNKAEIAQLSDSVSERVSKESKEEVCILCMCVNVFVCVCMYLYVCVCIWMCVYVCLCI